MTESHKFQFLGVIVILGFISVFISSAAIKTNSFSNQAILGGFIVVSGFLLLGGIVILTQIKTDES